MESARQRAGQRMATYLQDRRVPGGTAATLCKLAREEAGLRGPFESGGFLYDVDHFLDSSGTAGFDMELVNRALGIENGPLVAIALAVGDDPICLDLESGRVVLWLVEDGEQIVLADTFEEFASMITGKTD